MADDEQPAWFRWLTGALLAGAGVGLLHWGLYGDPASIAAAALIMLTEATLSRLWGGPGGD